MQSGSSLEVLNRGVMRACHPCCGILTGLGHLIADPVAPSHDEVLPLPSARHHRSCLPAANARVLHLLGLKAREQLTELRHLLLNMLFGLFGHRCREHILVLASLTVSGL